MTNEVSEMGKEAEVQDNDDIIEQPEPEEEGQESPTPEGEQGAAGTEDDDEVEIVHAGDSPAPDEGKRRGPPRRVRKLLERNERLSTEMEQLQYQNRLLQMQLEQGKPKGEEPKAPTLEGCNYDEAEYQKALVEYMRQTEQSTVSQALRKERESQHQQQQSVQRRQAVEAHYERADKLRVPDYDDAETAAMEVLGRDTVEEIAAQTDDSELVLYYLGKNPDKAAEIKSLLDTNPVKATYALGKLSASLTARPKSKSSPKDPDHPVEGAGSGSGNTWEKKLDAAREKAAKTGDMSHVQAVKKAARAAGVDL